MGWLFGWDSRQALVDELRKDYTESQHVKLIDEASTCYGRHWWALLESDTVPHRFIVLHLLEKRGPRGQQWGYKDIDESMGPCEVDCPLKLLNLAGPDADADHQYAREWRQKVRAFHANRQARKQLKETDIVWIFGTTEAKVLKTRYHSPHRRGNYYLVRETASGNSYICRRGQLWETPKVKEATA